MSGFCGNSLANSRKKCSIFSASADRVMVCAVSDIMRLFHSRIYLMQSSSSCDADSFCTVSFQRTDLDSSLSSRVEALWSGKKCNRL